jgi:hypothetical protein
VSAVSSRSFRERNAGDKDSFAHAPGPYDPRVSGGISECLTIARKHTAFFQPVAGVNASPRFTHVRTDSVDTYEAVFPHDACEDDVSDHGLPLFAAMSDPFFNRRYRGSDTQFFLHQKKLGQYTRPPKTLSMGKEAGGIHHQRSDEYMQTASVGHIVSLPCSGGPVAEEASQRGNHLDKSRNKQIKVEIGSSSF